MNWETEIVNGMTWGWTGVRGTWGGPDAEHSLRALKPLGVNWIALVLSALQETAQSTVIRYRDAPNVTDEETRWAIRQAKALGMKTILKPVVNCADGTWRAHIGFFPEEVPGEPSWADWFAAYGDFILHYARIAEEEGCEMLCIGCEMVQADAREAEWRGLIAKVRAAYGGLITYNCDKYQEDRVTWWDAVDVISSSGYYPTGAWERELDRIERTVARWRKPFFFMETGCPSRSGSSRRPNDWSLAGAPDEAEQARWYAEMFAACSGRPWLRGYVLWDWPAKLYDRSEASNNGDYCMYGKQAEETVKMFYLGRLQGERPASEHASTERQAAAIAREWRAELERELKTNILAFWIRHAPDERNGGFFGEISGDLTAKPQADKGLVLNARILWTYACAYRVYGDSGYSAMAERAYDALHDVFRDREHGGLYWTATASGQPAVTKKQVYGQAFAIYALAEYVRAKGARSGEALAWAEELFRLLEKHAYDPVHRGYVEALARDWTETDDQSLGSGGLNERKSMNTHLHLLEAYANLYRVWQPEGLRGRLAELIDIHLDRIVNASTPHFQLFFDDAWNAKVADISYGHDIEGSWLLCEAAVVLGDPARQSRVRREALAMADATLSEGMDEDGGLWNELHGDGRLDDHKDWWPQAEAMVGFLNAWQLSGDSRYWDAARGSWAFIQRHMVDRERGEWHGRVSRRGEPIPKQVKAGLWKCPYHNSRACFEGMERLDKILCQNNHY